MKRPKKKHLPIWVTIFCLVSPYLALLSVAIASLIGFPVSAHVAWSLAGLCGSTTLKLV